jgi:ribosomal-protein-alanine N-acetyltransferase
MAKRQTKISKIVVRTLLTKDKAKVLEIENLSYPDPWTADIFKNCLGQKNCIGMVCEVDGEVRGFYIFEIHRKHNVLVSIATHPDFRRRGLGTEMINDFKNQPFMYKKNLIITDVPDDNLVGHLFLKSTGFIATKVDRFLIDGTQDSYRFEFKIKEQKEEKLCRGITKNG